MDNNTIKDLVINNKPLDGDVVKFVDDNFWDLVDGTDESSIFGLAEQFINEAQTKSEYVDIDSAAIYSDKFIEDFKAYVVRGKASDDNEEILDRMVRVLKDCQFDYDYIDEEGNLYSDEFIKHFKRKCLLEQKKDTTKKIEN